jgi:hypothetical protein
MLSYFEKNTFILSVILYGPVALMEVRRLAVVKNKLQRITSGPQRKIQE